MFQVFYAYMGKLKHNEYFFKEKTNEIENSWHRKL